MHYDERTRRVIELIIASTQHGEPIMPPIKHISTLSLACAISIAASGQVAHALSKKQQVTIGGVAIELVLPEGHCVMSRDNERDRGVIELLEKMTFGLNEVLLAFANCDHLDAWHNGQRQTLGEFGWFQTAVKAKTMNLKGVEAKFIKRVCDGFRSKGEGFLQGPADHVNKKLKSLETTMSTNETKFLGIYSESARQCTTSFIRKVVSEEVQPKTLYGINSNIILNGKLVYFSIMTNYEGEETLAAIWRKHAAAMDALLAGN